MNQLYEENVKNLIKIDAADVASLHAGAFVYFGRVTCRFCREFSEDLKHATVPIYYVDTTLTAVDEVLQQVRDEYNVLTVPTFIHKRKDGRYDKLNRDVRQSIRNFIQNLE